MDIENLSFGNAIEKMKLGDKVARKGWNGKGMWLAIVNGWDMQDSNLFNEVDDLETIPWIGMKTAQDQFVPWLASQSDMLANDWCVIDRLNPR